jgi:hypothetical protein
MDDSVYSSDIATHLVYAAADGGFVRKPVTVRDARGLIQRPSLEREGFALVTYTTRVTNFFDPAKVRSVCYPEIENILKEATGAARVVAFEHDVRCASTAERRARGVREPVRVVHDDYTAKSSPERARLYLGDEADELLRGHYSVINVWLPIAGPVLDTPLAVCDAQSMAETDLLPTEQGVKHEVYMIKFSAGHRWYYFPAMTTEEALLLKCFDSRPGNHARFTAHSALDLPGTAPGAATRQSIEVRALVFFS